MPPVVERKLAAILSADVKGYSRLMGDDEVSTVRTLTAHREIMATCIQEHRGRVVDAPGDNLLAEFGSVVDAVECAADLQRELGSRNTALPSARRMEFRIGINLGDVIVDGERIYGDGVNIAARVESMADAGGIAVSGTVYDQVKGKLPLDFEDLGRQVVKNIRDPVRIYRVRLDSSPARRGRIVRWLTRRRAIVSLALMLIVAAGAAGAFGLYGRTRSPALELPDRPSIAVLPFQNMSGDASQEYFSDGMTEDLITGLSKLSGLFVIARNSVFVYKGKTVKPADVSRELGVRYVLEGSVRKADNRVRITAQLVDASTGYHVWAERYDRELKDVFALQDDVTQKIVSVLAVKLTPPEKDRLVRTGTQNLEAYDYVLRGLEYKYQTTREGNEKARASFKKAIQIDPKYAAAYMALGWVYLQEWQLQWTRDSEDLERAFELAQQAIALDDSLANCHSLLGQVYLWKKKYDQAIAEAERAVALGPNDADGYETLAEVLAWSGRPRDAIGYIKRAMRLNPQYPFFYLWTLGHAYYLTEQNAEAIAAFKELVARNPNFVPAHAFLAILYTAQGRDAEARPEWAAATRLSPHVALENWKQVLPYKNERDLARFLAAMSRAGLK